MANGKILVANQKGVYIMKLVGDVRVTLCSTVDAFIDKMFADGRFESVLVDLTAAEGVDSTTLGLLARLSIETEKRLHEKPNLLSDRQDINRILSTMGLDDVFVQVSTSERSEAVETAEALASDLEKLPEEQESEAQVKQHVLDAHRTLMSLSEHNRAQFKDLVETLEAS